MVFGGVHATLYPEGAHKLGGAHAIVKGDFDSPEVPSHKRGSLQNFHPVLAKPSESHETQEEKHHDDSDYVTSRASVACDHARIGCRITRIRGQKIATFW